MIKETIQNRKGHKIVVQIEEKENPKGLVFVMHGLSGNKEQSHIRTMADAFGEKGYTVILFDTTNTFGESDGQLEDATITNYYEDLEDVIKWSKYQNWYKEPFILTGHSLGGICIIIYAEKYPNEVSALAPISTVVSGKLSFETKGEGNLDEWKEKGIREWEGHSGQMKRLKWSHMEDRLKHDVLKEIDRIKVPVLLIVGEHDISTPVEHQQFLYEKLNCEKEIHIIKGSEHTFRANNELAELKSLMTSWIKKLIKMENNFTGVIIEESLENKEVLKKVKIIKTEVEQVTEEHKTPWIKQWTLHTVEIPKEKVDFIAAEISNSLDSEHNWYADFKDEIVHYIIFRDRVFKIDRTNKKQYEEAKKYGISLGIPEYQVDFHPEVKEWER